MGKIQEYLNTNITGPGWVALWVRVLSPYAKVAGSISGQGTHRKQPMKAEIKRTTKSMFFSPLSNR